MRTSARAFAIAIAVGASCAPSVASAFTSGSTGSDGAFAPTVNTTVTLPPSGIFNYTTVTIPAGVTVKFQRNTTNTPIVILATGDVTIAGTIDISGTTAPGVGPAGGGGTGDDGTPGLGGPGGFDGGRGGRGGTDNPGPNDNPNAVNKAGGGLGPGGGNGGVTYLFNAPCLNGGPTTLGGTGGGFSAAGGQSPAGTVTNCAAGFSHTRIPGGAAYGSSPLLPLVGGSGGGGGSGGHSSFGAGGGGGGGAILIAASGTVSVSGSLLANGGAGGGSSQAASPPTFGAAGGGASGGAIRIVATTVTGEGTISANAGANGDVQPNCCAFGAAAGAPGRIRIEAENLTRTAASSPTHSFASPGQVFVAGTPTLRISSVAGVNAPAAPTGSADITLPATTPNPVTVVFTTSGVPVGNTVQLTVTPATGDKITVITPALTGSTATATASTTVSLPLGPSVLSAQTTYTVVAALGDLLRNFAGNERVEKITLVATLGGKSQMKLITVTGREYDAPEEALRIAAMGG
jgi:hypothetical protein